MIGLPPIFARRPASRSTSSPSTTTRGRPGTGTRSTWASIPGTHFDAPIHWITGKDLPNNACDTIEPRRFVGPACVIDITREVEANPDYLLTPQDLERWEKQNGRVPKNAWVLLRTGWSKRTTAKEFLNVGDDGPHAPGFHQETSRILAHDRDVLGVGVETIGTDAGQAGRFDPPFPNHYDDARGWQVRAGQPL